MASVTVTRTTPLFPDAVFVQWDIQPDESGTHLVQLFRAGGPEGPWEPVMQAPQPGVYCFVDDQFNLPPSDRTGVPREGANLFSLSREVYYQIQVTPPSGPTNQFVSDPTPIEPSLDVRTRLLKRKILFDESLGFRVLNGIQIMALKRRRWGTRCPICYDLVLGESTQEHCAVCYGTSFEGGYWAPSLIRGRRTPGPAHQQMTGHGDSQVKKVTFTVLDYPHLEPKDILVDLRRNERYIVEIVSPTELKTVVVHQTITASLIAHDAVEYSITVDPYTTPPLY